ncbi:MAG: hypothetical protein V8Q95_07870 [Collinsella sp.]
MGEAVASGKTGFRAALCGTGIGITQRRQQGSRRPLRPGSRHHLSPLMPVASSTPTSWRSWWQDHRPVPDGRYHACLPGQEPDENSPEDYCALIAKIDACNKADAEAQVDP